jgi:predicted MFS family arabinose efflux permease
MTEGAARREWREHWPLILTCLVGSTFTGQHVYSTGAIMKPLNDAFGWTRGQVSLTVTFSSIATILVSIWVGVLTQRYGARRVALVAAPLSALTFLAVGFTGPSLWTYYAAFAIFAVVQVAVGPIVWASAVTSSFKVSRGLALGVGLSGTGFASLVYPLAAMWLLEHSGFGWRGVFFGLASGGLVLLMPLLIFAFRPVHRGESRAAPAANGLWGATFGQAVRSLLYWRVVLVLTVAALTISTVNIHLIPMLTDSGMTRLTAASVVGVVGISTLAGRWIGGFLLDRIHAKWIAIAFFLLPALGCALLSSFEGSLTQAVAAAALIGVSYGVEGDMLPFLIGRYFGPRAYSKIFGLTMTFFGLGYALAPVSAGFLFDAIGSYDAFFLMLAGLLVLAALVSATFGRYPQEALAEASGAAAIKP